MAAYLAYLKATLFRKIKYLLRRPKPPKLLKPFSGPVVVVGSAPNSNKPIGMNEHYQIITINGSQAAIKQWGIPKPDFTFLQHRPLHGDDVYSKEVRRVLTGERTGTLYVLLWRDGIQKLNENLRRFDYGYDDVQIVNRYERIALVRKVAARQILEKNESEKLSNGVIAVLFALHHQASAVIISGINPHSTGHAYNQNNATRKHTQTDGDILVELSKKGHPLFTADPHVSETLGIPLWNGDGRQTVNKTEQNQT